ncbi:MAG: hypothetical protein GYB68_02015, partial [Chloroflexi bacterium]|nr:hypothetical protein [Chloroflexota bacterium]
NAAWHGQAPAVQALIDVGAAVNAIEQQFGGSPLLHAAHGAGLQDGNHQHDYLERGRALLEAGADPGLPNLWDETPLDIKQDNGEAAIAALIAAAAAER